MDVGIGLPATIAGVEGAQVVEWARRAEARGFSSLGVIDRVVYDNYEPLVALAAAAAVTERIKLVTAIAIAPYRGNGVLAAKQAATIDHLSGGRLVLGVAVGGRDDDFTATDEEFATRGRRFDAMLDEWAKVWSGESYGFAGRIGPPSPSPGGRPGLVFGGTVDRAYERAAEHGDGWIMGGGTPDMLAEGAEKTRAAWKAAGREGEPRIMALCYFALGEHAEAAAIGYLGDYYAFLGDFAGQIAAGAAKDAGTVAGYVQGFAAAGCDELIMFPCDPDPGQVDLLADALP